MSTPRTIMLEAQVGGRTYRFAGPPDQEARLKALAARVDALMAEMKSTEPNADRDRHMVLAMLTLCSDLADAQGKLDDQVGAVTRFHRQLVERLEALLPAHAA